MAAQGFSNRGFDQRRSKLEHLVFLQAIKGGMLSAKIISEYTSGANAHGYSAGLVRGLNPPAPSGTSFGQTGRALWRFTPYSLRE
jgi:hypothetical protein